MLGIFKTIALAATAILAFNVKEQSSLNGYQAIEKGNRVSVNMAASMPVRVDAGWYSFAYGKPGTVAYRNFMVKNGQVVQLEVVGCFCPYNYFSVFDNGQPIIVTAVNGTLTPEEDYLCEPNVTDPNICAANRTIFGYGIGLLLPGTHNITVMVRDTPYLGGTAFLRVDTICTSPEDAFSPKPCCFMTGTCSTAIVA